MARNREIQEVDDVPEADAVEEVADGAPENQREADLETDALVRRAERVRRDDQEDDHGHAVEQHRLERRIDRREEAEGRAAVAHIGQVEDVLDDRLRLVDVHRAGDDALRPLVQEQDGEGHRQVRAAVERRLPKVRLHAGTSASTDRQRSHRPVASASVFTFQQRSHRRPRAFKNPIRRPGYAWDSCQSAGAAAGPSTTSETMNRSASPAPEAPVAARSASRASLPESAIAPSRDDPMVLSRRACSRITEASSLNFVSRSQAASQTESAGTCKSFSPSKRERWTDSSFFPGRAAQISSAVKGRTGAMTPASARAMRHRAVCADRRSEDAAADA